jgi:dTDP-4-amino-4,6-dideoxygalactose transaminase
MGVGLREVVAAAWTLERGQLARYGGSATSATDRFERELEAFTGAGHALAVNSGTSALICALAALHVGPGDEVLVPAYTWVSSAAAVVAVGALPVLVEIDRSLTMDPDDLKQKVTSRSRAVIAVHMLNLVCDMTAIMSVAEAHDLLVIEDACQAVGVRYKGRPVGSIGHAGAFSFNQHKNIRSGEGGAILTSDRQTYDRAMMFHDVGNFTRQRHEDSNEPAFVGMNLRMPELCSAILRTQLRRLDRQIAKRRLRRDIFVEALAERGDLTVCPHHDPGAAAGLAVYFDDPGRAARFAELRGVTRLIDTDRHVYLNWQSVVQRRTFDPRVNPWQRSSIVYGPESCPITLETLKRTCSISVDADIPMPMIRVMAKAFAAPASPPGSAGTSSSAMASGTIE